MPDPPPTSFANIPELLRWVMSQRRVTSQRAAAMYIGVEPAVFGRWLAGSYRPSAESCELIAHWAGLPLTTVLEAADRIPRGQPIDAIPGPRTEIAPELGLVIRHFWPTAADQARLARVLPLLAELRDEFAPGDATPLPRPAPPPPSEPPAPFPPEP